MEQVAALRQEVEQILMQDAFGRAPSQSKILKYLLERGCDSSAPITQYDIATAALGKADSFDETTDSSVRVQVGRLRQSMREYYRLNQPTNELYAYIPSSEYRLRMANLKTAYPAIFEQLEQNRKNATTAQTTPEERTVVEAGQPPIHHAPSSQKWYQLKPAYLSMAAVAASLVAIFGFNAEQLNVQAVPSSAIAPPKVAAAIEVAGDQQFRDRLSNFSSLTAVDTQSILKKSMVSKALTSENQRLGDYRVQIYVTEQSGGQLRSLVTLQDRNDNLLLEREISSDSPDHMRDGIRDAMIAIVSPAGVISNDLAQNIAGDPRNGFECFIATENYRSDGTADASGVLGSCIRKYRSSEYYPYLAVRDLFARIQGKTVRGEAVGPQTKEWAEISEILDEHPANTYANTLAAKMLIGDGSCADAEQFAVDAFSRGRTYPALELAVIVDAYGCKEVAQYRSFWAERITQIAGASPNPHPLLESYMLLGLVASDQRGLISNLKPLSFSTSESTQLESFNEALRRILEGRGNASDRKTVKMTIPALIWNRETQEEIEAQIFTVPSDQA